MLGPSILARQPTDDEMPFTAPRADLSGAALLTMTMSSEKLSWTIAVKHSNALTASVTGQPRTGPYPPSPPGTGDSAHSSTSRRRGRMIHDSTHPPVSSLYAGTRPSARCRRVRRSSWLTTVTMPLMARAPPIAAACTVV